MRTEIKLERPNALAPPIAVEVPQQKQLTTTPITSDQALELLSFPIIEIIEYMPEKGVQFPDPDDFPEKAEPVKYYQSPS